MVCANFYIVSTKMYESVRKFAKSRDFNYPEGLGVFTYNIVNHIPEDKTQAFSSSLDKFVAKVVNKRLVSWRDSRVL